MRLPGNPRRWGMTAGFTVASYALAFWQRPGWATADTKIDLHVDPGAFLSFVASAWTSTGDLGEVHSAQYSGYLWPMGPFFYVFHALGVSSWVTERIWLGTIFALASWGMLRLIDVLVTRERGVTHLVATAFFLLNPYVVVFTARTSITLLGYAALPWLLIVTYHGLRATRGWRGWRPWWWAAGFALILTSTGGGVNAAVLGWMLVGPLVLMLYEPAVGAVRWRATGGFLARVGVFSVLASLWWIVPVLVHVRYGIDFLQFTEQPGTIWGTNSLTESLRLMGYWTSYIGVGFGAVRPFFSDGGTMLFNILVVGASLLLPALAAAAFARAGRGRHATLLAALAVVGVVIETAGFPNGTPVRGTMVWIYEHIFVLSFMRTTNKAAPLVAVGVAGLLGIGAQDAWWWVRRRKPGPRRTAALIAAPLALATLIALAALPLVRGGAIDTQLSYRRIPAAWVNAGQALNQGLPANTRAIVLPGQIFAYYNWGGTLDAILPRLTNRPVAVRYETPYSDLHAVDLLTTIDDLVQQNRLVPGQLEPLLRLIGVGSVVTGADDDVARSGALDPATAARVLAGQGFSRPAHSYGPVKTHPPAAGDVGSPVALPEVRSYGVSGARGIVHLDPIPGPTIVDGGAQTLADLSAFGALPSRAAILYAGDQTAGGLRALAAPGADLVVGDSNRRQEYLPESGQQNRGPTLAAGQPIPTSAAVVNPFAPAGTDAQTVAALAGARYLRTPVEPGELQFPESAPASAFDGNLQTAWVADRNLPVSDRWLEVGFNAPRAVPYVDVYPLSDSYGTVTEVDVNGIRHAVGPGWTRIPLHLRDVSALRFTIVGLRQPPVGNASAGGFREIRIPGFQVQQWLRTPVVIGRELAGANLSRDSLSFLLDRVTGDDPFARNPYGVDTLLDNPADRGDAEAVMRRIVFAPATRSYSVDAWVYPSVVARDSELDRLAGYTGSDQFDSSARFQNQPAYRASSAFTARGGHGWVGYWNGARAPDPWISWSTPAPRRLARLQIVPSTLAVYRPTAVRISWPGGTTGVLQAAASGAVALPRPVSAPSFRLTVVAAELPSAATTRQRQTPAVGIGSLLVPGLAAPRIPTSGPLQAQCGIVAIVAGGHRVPLAVSGSVAQLDGGHPLRARGCAAGTTNARGAGRADVTLRAGVERISAVPGVFSVDMLRLHSPAPTGPPAAVLAAAGAPGRVVSPGSLGQSSLTGVQIALRRPGWLVLGESYDAGWQATCNGHRLGAPGVIDGYANGWLVPRGCTRVSFAFGPQAGVRTSYLVSAVTVVGLIALLLFGAFRGPTGYAAVEPVRRRVPRARTPAARSAGRPLWRAAALGLAAAIPLGYLFALRAGAGLFFVVTFVLWRGYSSRTLAYVAAALLGIVVPLAYLIGSPRNQGGYGFAYATQLIGAHWVGVTAIVLLGMSVLGLIRAARR